ncbi:MAG TPA: KTSC domain-containing protein [Candidatus Binatia bacterium]|jgi:hypothetical protein
MDRTRVNSRGIVSTGYEARSNTLEIEFPGGAVYEYLRVPEVLYRDLLVAESKGRFVNLYIKPYFDSREIDSNDHVYVDSSTTGARAGGGRARRTAKRRAGRHAP